MLEYTETACIVWPVIPKVNESAHCTVIFLGEVVGISGAYYRTLRALKESKLSTPGEVPVKGLEVFGIDKQVWVVTLDPDPLEGDYNRLLGALRRNGLDSASSFPDYRPHVTLFPYVDDVGGFEYPDSFTLLSPQLWWGEHKIHRFEWEFLDDL